MTQTAELTDMRGGRRSSRAALGAIPGSDSHAELVALLRDATGFLHDRFARHGRVWRTRFVFPVVFLVGEEANKSILVTRRHELSFGRGYAQTPVKRVFDGSIMLQDGEAHDRMRDILSPAVGKLALHDAVAAIDRIWSVAVERAAGLPRVDAYGLTERATFDVAANVLTGLALGDETDEMRPLFERLVGGIMAPFPLRIPFGRLDRSLRARKAISARLAVRVAEARARPPSGLVGQLAHHRDEAGAHLPIDEIVGHLLLLFWAGYDTTASAASWVLKELAQRPEWQARLRDEIQRVAQDDPGAVEDPRALPMLNAFLFEIERMYPSALFFPRIAEVDIAFDAHVIPRGTPVFYSPYLSHRDPALYEHPNAFDPERWSEARGDRRAVVGKLVGFGGGPRVCLGKTFAKLQLKLMVRALLRAHFVELDPTAHATTTNLPVHHPHGLGLRIRRS
jgi:cytochrome P450